MHCVGSARPALRSSASRICQYSTVKGKIVSEWDGIIIPSRQEIQEKVKEEETRRKKYEADISYLKNAPAKSLASRLARRTPKVEPKPEPVKSEPLSAAAREHIEEITRRRKEVRIARETARAKAAIDQIMPMSDMSKVVQVASNFKVGSVPLTTRPQAGHSRNNELRRERSPTALPHKTFTRRQPEQHPPVTPRVEVATEEPVDLRLSEVVANTLEETLPELAENQEAELEEDEDTIELSDVEPSPMFQNAEVREQIASTIYKSREQLVKEGLVLDTKPLSQEELVAESAARRRENRLRRQAEELKLRRNIEGIEDSNLKPELRDSIAQRKAARMARLNSAHEEIRERRTRKKNRTPSSGSLVPGPESANETFEIEDGEENVGPAFTGPEPISSNLFEIFQPSILASQNAVAISSKKTGSHIGAVYAHHVGKPSFFYSTPPDQLGPFNLAKAVLAHRPDVSPPQRRSALDIIIASTQRSKQTPVRA